MENNISCSEFRSLVKIEQKSKLDPFFQIPSPENPTKNGNNCRLDWNDFGNNSAAVLSRVKKEDLITDDFVLLSLACFG